MRFFVDSCIFIEAFKKNGIKETSNILETILLSKKIKLFCINSIVESEVFYYFLFKQKSKLKLTKDELKVIIRLFNLLSLESEIRFLFWNFIEKYNLKPNDALILATCKHYGIKYLISLDEDFEEPCEKEGITLINSAEKLKEVLENKI